MARPWWVGVNKAHLPASPVLSLLKKNVVLAGGGQGNNEENMPQVRVLVKEPFFRMQTMKPIAAALIIFTLTGCASYTITKEELIQQFKENQSSQETNIFGVGAIPALICGSKYQSNSIRRITCLNSSGERLYLYPDRNTQLEITSKSSKEVVKMYFDTALLVENRLVGLRSRLLSACMIREIPIDDIEKIEITAEFPKTEKVKEAK